MRLNLFTTIVLHASMLLHFVTGEIYGIERETDFCCMGSTHDNSASELEEELEGWDRMVMGRMEDFVPKPVSLKGLSNLSTELDLQSLLHFLQGLPGLGRQLRDLIL